jgi:hypothetical protein
MSDESVEETTSTPADDPPQQAVSNSFQEMAENDQQPGIIREFIEFLSESKSWWLTPIIVVLLLVGVLVLLSSTVVAPFIYPMF